MRSRYLQGSRLLVCVDWICTAGKLRFFFSLTLCLQILQTKGKALFFIKFPKVLLSLEGSWIWGAFCSVANKFCKFEMVRNYRVFCLDLGCF